MLAFALMLVAGQITPPPAPPAPPPVDCTDADHKALDFWIGDWDVSIKAVGRVVAQSRIERIDNCAISETYHQTMGPKGKPLDYRGRSISSYVPEAKNWRQFYIDNTGAAATYDGGLEKGSMVFLSHFGGALNRMTYEPLPDGAVNQRGETSTDEGKTWAPTFDLIYRRHPGGLSAAP